MTMNDLKNILQNADPLRHERAPHADDVEQARRAVVGGGSSVENSRQHQSRRRWIAAAAVASLSVALLQPGFRSLFVTAALAAVAVEVRLAEEQPAAGLREMKVPGSDRLVYVHREVVVSNADIAQAEVVESGTPARFNVAIEFTPDGTKNMTAATAGHIGRPLVILLDDQVVMAPMLRSAIGSSAVITGDFSRAEAERIANGIR